MTNDELINEALSDYARILAEAKERALEGPYDLYRYICEKQRSVRKLLAERNPGEHNPGEHT